MEEFMSAAAPIFFFLYMLPLGLILGKYGVSFHSYTEDTQLYWSFNSSSALGHLLACVDEVKSWMAANFLSLDESKTEVIIFGPSEMSDMAGINLGILKLTKLSKLVFIN